MKPRRSRSRAMVRVSGECGEPASITTSVLAPLAARFARRFRRCDRRDCHMIIVPVPRKATIAAVRARFREIQFWARER